MVWEEDRFVTKVEGTNGFVCLVLRDPFGRYEPSALNEAAMKSVFPVYEYQTRELAKGKSIDEILAAIEAKAKSGEFPAPEPGAIVYMMSPKNKYYNFWSKTLDDIEPHIMLYYPKLDGDQLGFTGEKGLPMFYNEYSHMSVVHILTD